MLPNDNTYSTCVIGPLTFTLKASPSLSITLNDETCDVSQEEIPRTWALLKRAELMTRFGFPMIVNSVDI